MTTSDSGWSDYWSEDSAAGEVFVGVSGKRHPALGEHWHTVFAGVPPGTKILDIASGAGSIYATLPDDHGFVLHATDIAVQALEALVERIPGVETFVASADRLPFESQTYDLVVSQFGIEYAGVGAFAEAGRVVADGGRLAVLAHIEDGYIDANNKAQLSEALLVQESGFIAEAISLTRSAFDGDVQLLAEKERAFIPLIRQTGDAMRRCRQGVHSYLLRGFQKLYDNRYQYDLADIVGWLEGMQGEVDKAIDRLSRMRAAALSEADIAEVRALLESDGFKGVTASPFMTPNSDRPVAWDLRAARSD